MRSDRRARVIGAAAVVAIAGGLALRYARRQERPGAPLDAGSASAPAVTTVARGEIEALASGELGVLAVGKGGLVLRLRRGGDWQRDTPAKVDLHGVAQQLDEAVAVGDDGTILELDHDAWRAAPRATDHALRAVAYTTYGAIAVGDGGVIVRRAAPGEPWRVEPSPTTSDLHGACAGLRDVWIVGRGVIVFHAPLTDLGNPWKLQPSPTPATLRAVACDGDHAAAAVGDGGAMIERLDDVGWHESPSGTQRDLFAVAAPLGTRSWLVVGAGGVALRESGSPAPLATGVSFDLRAATDGALGTFLAGAGGVVRVTP